MTAKERQKDDLKWLRNKYLIDIYAGLTKGDSVKTIHKTLLEDTINQKKRGYIASDDMLNTALKATNTLKKKVGSQTFVAGYVKTTYGKQVEDFLPIELMSVFVFDLIDKQKIEKRLTHHIVEEADHKEGEIKKEVINDYIQENRDLTKPKIFYLASKHKDSASDHAQWQGHIYIDEKWRSYVDEKTKQKIEKYIAANDVRTVQWVMDKPVWFITRPNCRHYFEAIATNEVLKTPKTKLLKRHDMTTAIGDRQYLQTIKHAIDPEWYKDIRNAQLVLEKYKERLELHKGMYKAVKNDILRKAINKDKMLIRKWEEYIKKRSNGADL